MNFRAEKPQRRCALLLPPSVCLVRGSLLLDARLNNLIQLCFDFCLGQDKQECWNAESATMLRSAHLPKSKVFLASDAPSRPFPLKPSSTRSPKDLCELLHPAECRETAHTNVGAKTGVQNRWRANRSMAKWAKWVPKWVPSCRLHPCRQLWHVEASSCSLVDVQGLM